MNSLLEINNDMNVFSLNFHSGDRNLYDSLVALGGRFPEIISSIKDYPLFTMAVERGEEEKYAKFVSQLENLYISSDEVKNSSRVM